MTTKIDIVNDAYSKLRISGLTVQPSPSDQVLALTRLENMVSELEVGRNICMDYNFEVTPDPNTPTNVPQPFWECLGWNLALRCIPDFNKTAPPTLMSQASASLGTASAMSAANNIREVQYSRRQARGSGNTRAYLRFSRFMRPAPLPPGVCSTNSIFIGDINDYEETYRAYLNDGETISSFTIEADSGITIVSSSIDSPLIKYRAKATENVDSGPWQLVKIVITTSDGRELTRFVNFEVKSDDLVTVA